MTTRAALYLRQSLDRDGRGDGITRQRERCAATAAARDWEVVGEYVDNDTSATKPRGPGTAWHRLIADVRAGKIDVVVAVDQDRLLRGLRDLLTLLELGVKITTVDGEIDLATADGEFRATLSAGLARFEVRRKGERQKRSNQQARQMGLPPGGRRAFGYTALAAGAKATTATRRGADGREWPAFGHEPHEPEASAVRWAYDAVLAGASLGSIARDLNARGLTTTQKRDWTPNAVRGMLANPRYGGLVAPPRAAGSNSHKHSLGLAELPVGRWEPLVTPETWAAARDLLSQPGRRSNGGAPTRTLLSGVAKCGRCGASMKGGATGGVPLYRCAESPHLARKRDDADLYVAHVVVERLSRPDAADLLIDRERPDVDALRAELRTAQQGEADVLAMVARGLTSLSAAEAILRDTRATMARLEAQLSDAGTVDVLGPLIAADDVLEMWNALDVDRQRAVVATLLSIELHSPGKGSRPPRTPEGRLEHTASTVRLTWRRG